MRDTTRIQPITDSRGKKDGVRCYIVGISHHGSGLKLERAHISRRWRITALNFLGPRPFYHHLLSPQHSKRWVAVTAFAHRMSE